jgi:hypothetical protein
MAIAEVAGVTTYTAGQGPDRHVVVTRDDGPAESPAEEVREPEVDIAPEPPAETDDAAPETDEA